MRRILFAVVALASLAAAHAEARVLHDVPWYKAHDAARKATVQLCESDARFANLPDCNNAEAAAAGVMFGKGDPNSGLNYMYDPKYWAANRVARDDAWVQCQAGKGLMLPYCSAIRASFALNP
ncbi:MAG TPA: EexN family lipoprotein [Acetobacteraceae bacterium]|nr:EexN family lipoprotein [Acetobacteraceae bacterium]